MFVQKRDAIEPFHRSQAHSGAKSIESSIQWTFPIAGSRTSLSDPPAAAATLRLRCQLFPPGAAPVNAIQWMHPVFSLDRNGWVKMKRICLFLAFAVLFCAAPARAQSVDGDWQGALQIYGSNLRLNLHIVQDEKGVLSGTIESPELNTGEVQVSSFKLKKTSFSFQMPSYNGVFEGRLSSDGLSIIGTLYQGDNSLPLTFNRRGVPPSANNTAPKNSTSAPPQFATPAAAQNPSAAAQSAGTARAQSVDGLWVGVIDVGGQQVHARIHISHDSSGAVSVTFDSPDQGVNGMATSNPSLKDSALHFEISAAAASYDGTLDAAKGQITGTWKQGGASLSLNFTHSDQPQAETRRPQDPVKPYPYLEEDVAYSNPKATGVTLAGTLTMPKGPGPFPAAILISGSGAHDRDEALLGHRPFLVISDYLTRHGIAVLRYDKRGVGKSTGEYATATSDDFASDTEASITYLKTRKEINPWHIGLIGHSEGGLIAPLVASRDSSAAWIVLLGGPGLRGDQILFLQEALIAKAEGASDEAIKQNHDLNAKLFFIVENEQNPANLTADLQAVMNADPMGSQMPAPSRSAAIKQISTPWMREFLTYDPVPALEKTKCPVLAMDGEHDLQVPAEEDLAAIKKALEAGGNKDFETIEIPGVNHLFQHSATGSPAEYQKIDETFAPEALDIMTKWIQKHSSI